MGHHRPRGRDRRESQGLSGEDKSRLSQGFLDQNGMVRKESVVEDAEHFGEMFAGKGQGGHTNKVSTSQMRNFYQEVRRIWELVAPPGVADDEKMEKRFASNQALLLMVVAKVNYGVGREGKKLPISFRDYLAESVKKVDSAKHFGAFMKSFEAMVGYFYSNNPGP